MKRITSLVLCALLLLASVSCGNGEANENGGNEAAGDNQSTVTDENDDNAAKVEEYEGPWVVVKQVSNSYLYQTFVYDEAGRVIEQRGFNTKVSKDEPTSVTPYTYTEREDGTVQVRFGSDGSVVSGYEIVYSADGICLESSEYQGFGGSLEDVFTEQKCIARSLYEYDAQNRVTKLDRYSLNYDYPSRNSNTAYTISYDDNGRILKAETLSNGAFFQAVTYTYNENGDVITHNIDHVDDSWDAYEEYESSYDYSGEVLMSKAIENDRGSDVYRCDYEYDEQGRLCSMTIKAGYDGMIPADFFTGDGYRVDTVCFNGVGGTVVLMPLALVLEQQNAQ